MKRTIKEMARVNPVIKWSGSKSSQAERILKEIPAFERYFEPFLGGGSVLYKVAPQRGICGDICEPLVGIWNLIKDEPLKVCEYYNKEWNRLQLEGHQVFYEVRERFNINRNPLDLLFLSRTCVNGLIRFNSEGNFNNSFHLTRKGINPERFNKIVMDWNKRIQGVEFVCQEYYDTTRDANRNDFVYLDPPYENTKGRYYGTSTIDFEEFYTYLDDLNRRGVKFALSFDGIRGDKEYGTNLPKELYKRELKLSSGNSSFKKVMDKSNEEVLESLYLSW